MKLTAGHDCIHPDCTALAVYGMSVGGITRWACRAHQSAIGFSQPAGPAVPVEAAPQAPAPQRTAPAAPSSQGRLL